MKSVWIPLTTLFVALGFSSDAAAAWTYTGSLSSARGYHSATLLPNGKVLVAGGTISGAGSMLASTEIYDPTTGTWTPGAPMTYARAYHTATLLKNGKVLVTGGMPINNQAELYDPETNTWSISSPTLWNAYFHTATLLPSGKVLFAVGTSMENMQDGCGGWTTTPGTPSTSYGTASLMQNGKVFLFGGLFLPILKIYDPITNTFSTPSGPDDPYTLQTDMPAVALPNGKLLLLGSDSNTSGSVTFLYDPTTNTWQTLGTPPNPHSAGTAILTPSGKPYYISGGNGSPTSGTSIFDPVTNTWTSGPSLNLARYGHTATLIGDRVLVVGGNTNPLNTMTATVEVGPVSDVPGPNWMTPTISQIDGLSIFPVNVSRGYVHVLQGTSLTSLLEASSGMTRNSATNLPRLFLRTGVTDIDLSASLYQHKITDTQLRFFVPSTVPTGSYTLRVQVNGIDSMSRSVTITNGSAPTYADCGSVYTSVRSGDWSAPCTWDAQEAPTSCINVVVQSAHTVTLDRTNLLASQTTVSGSLLASSSQPSDLSLYGGDLQIQSGGLLNLETSGSHSTSVVVNGRASGRKISIEQTPIPGRILKKGKTIVLAP